MDVRLLDALNNLSFSLELMSEALKEGNSAKSDVAKALSGGDFFKVISEIKVGIDELKENVSEISVKQDTILELSKENSKKLDVQTDLIKKQSSVLEGIQSDIKNRRDDSPIDTSNSKNQSGIKKGIATILLIAVAVLAIGVAFKLIGGVNFLSVIALSVGIFVIALAFERIAKMEISPKKAVETSLLMVIMAGGIMVSSWLLSLVAPMSISQVMTSLSIAGLFYFVLPVMLNVIDSMMTPLSITLPNGTKIKTKAVNVGKLIATAIFLPILMLTMSLGIMVASRVLSGVRVMSLGQIITTLLISGMFALAAPSMVKVIESLGDNRLGFAKLFQISLILPLVLLGISFGIMLSSYVLGMVKPIGLRQAITAILIAGMFTVISFGLAKLLSAFSGVNPTKAIAAAFLIPIVFTAVSFAVMLSSWVLGLVKPISFVQFLTALAISIIFIAFAFTLKLMKDSVANIDPLRMVLLPVLFAALSFAIMLSSWALAMVKPITMPQFLTALGISAIFVVAAFAIKVIGNNLDKIDIGTIWKLPLIFTAFSLAIMLSSHILSESATIPVGKILNLLFFSAVMALSVVLVGLAIWVIKKLGLGVTDLIKGGVAIVIIATTIMLTSLILSMGNYGNYPGLGWSIGVGASLIAFGLAAFLIGNFVTGPQAIATLAGLGAIVVIAAAVTAVSYILSVGKYDKYPGLGWAGGVALSVGGFGLAALGLGVAILATAGIGAVALAAGLGALVGIATTVVAVSYILAAGKYDKYPTASWIGGVGLAGTLFGIPAMALGVAIVGTLGLGMVALEAGLSGILMIANTIVAVSYILAAGKYDKYPTASWMGGVGLAGTLFGIPAMALGVAILGTLGLGMIALEAGLNGILMIANTIVAVSYILAAGKYDKYPTASWMGGVGLAGTLFGIPAMTLGVAILGTLGIGLLALEVGLSALVSIAKTMVEVDKVLSGGGWVNGPSVKWSDGVSSALNAFMPVYEMVSDSQDWFFSGPSIKDFSNAVETIATGIVAAAKTFAVGDVVWKNGPTYDWANGVSESIKGFLPVYEMLVDSQSWFSSGPSIKEFSNAIETISTGIVTAAKVFAVGDVVWKNGPTYAWSKGVSESIKGFMPVYEMLSESNQWFSSGPSIEDFKESIISISYGIKRVGSILSNGKFDNYPNKNWTKNISYAIESFKNLLDMNSIFDFVKISSLNRLVKSMVSTSRKLSTVKFSETTSKNISNMVSSLRKFSSFKNGLKSSFFTFGKSSVDLVADDMIRISKKFGINSKYFVNNIPPDYMKNINSNISSYLKLLKMVEKSQRSGLISNKSFNNKSISNITDGIVKMAKSFDKLSKSLSKFTSSIKGINTDKLNQLNGLTTNIATLSTVDSKSLDKVLKVLESRSAALSKILDRDDSKSGLVGKKKDGGVNSRAINSRVVKKSPELVRLDLMVKLLFSLNNIFTEGSAFDDLVYKKLGESGGTSTPSSQ
jgi:hypothetical protein